jgi:hypothetical protein
MAISDLPRISIEQISSSELSIASQVKRQRHVLLSYCSAEDAIIMPEAPCPGVPRSTIALMLFVPHRVKKGPRLSSCDSKICLTAGPTEQKDAGSAVCFHDVSRGPRP